MKRILVLLISTMVVSFSVSSCFGSNSKKVTLTTPKQDAQICWDLLENCSSLNEIQEVRDVINEYKSEYNKALNNGDITAPVLKEFLINCPNEIAIEDVEAYVANFGYSVNSGKQR